MSGPRGSARENLVPARLGAHHNSEHVWLCSTNVDMEPGLTSYAVMGGLDRAASVRHRRRMSTVV